MKTFSHYEQKYPHEMSTGNDRELLKQATTNSPMKKKVAVIGLDGARPDCIRVAKAPHIQQLAQEGYFSWNAQTEFQTISGAAWTALLTGVHSDKHHVFDNNFDHRDMQYETIFKIAKSHNPDLKAVAHSHWKPIITHIFEKKVLDIQSSGGDKKMAFRLVKDIEKDKGDLYFLQLDDIDGAGHHHTYHPESKGYLEAIELADQYVGQILAAIKKRPQDEEWLIILVSDHGGSVNGHGPAIPDCLNVILIFAGTPVKAKGEIPHDFDQEIFPELVDVVPTIAKFLEISPKEYWDGKPRI